MVTIRITPGEELPDEQTEEIKEIIVSEGLSAEIFSYYKRLSYEELPPIVIITLSGLIGGILGAMGKDIWEAFKRALIRVYLFLQNRWKRSPQLTLKFEDEHNSVIVNLPDGDAAVIEEAINKLQEYLNKRPSQSGWMWFDRDSHEWKEWTKS